MSTIEPTPSRSHNWLHVILYVLIAVSLLYVASFGGYLYGYSHSPVATQKVIRVLVPAPTRIVFYYPSGTLPPYQQELGTGNSYLFVHAFSLALIYQDVKNIAAHTDTAKFVEICHGSFGSCKYGWSEFSKQLTNDAIELGVDPYSHMTETPLRTDEYIPQSPGDWAESRLYLDGSYANTYKFNFPLTHYGRAIFSFTTCCGGSGRTFILESVDLYG